MNHRSAGVVNPLTGGKSVDWFLYEGNTVI